MSEPHPVEDWVQEKIWRLHQGGNAARADDIRWFWAQKNWDRLVELGALTWDQADEFVRDTEPVEL